MTSARGRDFVSAEYVKRLEQELQRAWGCYFTLLRKFPLVKDPRREDAITRESAPDGIRTREASPSQSPDFQEK